MNVVVIIQVRYVVVNDVVAVGSFVAIFVLR